MPIGPGELPVGIIGLDSELLIQLANQIMGVMCALIVAVTWKG